MTDIKSDGTVDGLIKSLEAEIEELKDDCAVYKKYNTEQANEIERLEEAWANAEGKISDLEAEIERLNKIIRMYLLEVMDAYEKDRE